MTDPRAGQPARPSDLVDVAALVTAYYALEPDPADPGQQLFDGRHAGATTPCEDALDAVRGVGDLQQVLGHANTPFRPASLNVRAGRPVNDTFWASAGVSSPV